jgi:ferredoxin
MFKSIKKEATKDAPVAARKSETRRQLLNRLSPLGYVKLDSSRCTACGLCAIECPTEALRFLPAGEQGNFHLVFKHGECNACGKCVQICPEQCLSLERRLETEKLAGETVLFSDRIIACERCNKPVGPQSMLDKIQTKLAKSGRASMSYKMLCPECKAILHNELRF